MNGGARERLTVCVLCKKKEALQLQRLFFYLLIWMSSTSKIKSLFGGMAPG
jgi:hypothetical protein